MKVLLLGLGRWGANHLRNLNNLPVELHVAETDDKRLEPARKLGIAAERLTTDYRRFLDLVDAAVIVTPAQTHLRLCKEFLEAGKDVFVEKPITLHSNEASELAQLAETQKRILQVGHIFRFDPATFWLRDSIQQGRFGDVRILRSNFSGFKRPRNDSGIMFADAIHFADMFNYLLDATPHRVSAHTYDFLGREMEDASLISLEYELARGKVWGTIETNYFLPGKYREVTVIGSEVSALCDLNQAQNKIRTWANKHVRDGSDFKAAEAPAVNVETPVEEPLMAELKSFINSVQTREPARADGWSGYHSVRVIEAAAEAAQTRRTVELKAG